MAKMESTVTCTPGSIGSRSTKQNQTEPGPGYTCISGSMAYLRAAGNGVVAEVIRERQHLHNIKGDSNVVIRLALYLGAKIEMAGRQQPLGLGSRR